MGRKNKRKRSEYRRRLGFNPMKYISTAFRYQSAPMEIKNKKAEVDKSKVTRVAAYCRVSTLIRNQGQQGSVYDERPLIVF